MTTTKERTYEPWREDAARHLRNEQYYRGLLVSIGEKLGIEAYTADDGTVMEDVLCAKIPEVVFRRLGIEL